MQCDQFEQIIEQQDGNPLPKPALAHLDNCETCRALTADFEAIRSAALDLGVEDLPVPERVWVSLRNQLEAEGLIHDAIPAAASAPIRWWTAFQRPAFAGAFLSIFLAAAAVVSYQSGAPEIALRQAPASQQGNFPVLSAENIFKDEALNPGDDMFPGFQKRDAAVTDSLRRNLGIVDNFIAMCEKSVREEPDNQMAREYLYGAYEQKAELLATAMNRSVGGGLQ